MSYWWYGIAAFVHFHAIFILVALLPYPTSKQWKHILENRPFTFFIDKIDKWKMYLAVLCPCFILFLDALREYYKFSSIEFEIYGDIEIRREARLNLLRAQRNYYISGSAFMICLIVPRLISILKENAIHSIQIETTMRATKVFRELVNVMEVERENEEENTRNDGGNLNTDLLEAIRKELEKLNQENEFRPDVRPLQLNELKEVLDYYERQRHGNTNRGSSIQNSKPVPSRQRSIFSFRSGNNNSTASRSQTRPVSHSHFQPRNRFGLF